MDLPFHPVTVGWFADQLGTPTDVQRQAWPVIAAGGHVLITAPTGTGKTLAAFLGALDQLLTGVWEPGGLRVLYVSPLKALNNDIRRNLLTPLAGLKAAFDAAEIQTPAVSVMVRSGDTPEDERRRLRRQAPEILITTPESLNILLTQRTAGLLFSGLRIVILDEIHAIIGSKRGTSLLTALERLVLWSGEFQRIGLSATVNPPELVAQALGGFLSDGSPRTVGLVASPRTKAYEIRVVLPPDLPGLEAGTQPFWQSLALDLRRRVADRTSTLIFTNSRRACEKLARLMNENLEEPIAYSHHGSLSKEIRLEVEEKLKQGALRSLVATNSLELGIDIGDLDEVILAQSPRTAASAIQKIGRAGHRIDQVSRARIYPSHGLDLVEAAVLVRCIRDQTVEPLVIPEGPLDVLAQTLLSALCGQPTTADHLFVLVRQAWPYRNLTRKAFDLVMDMLAGRYAGTRIAELKPRIELDATTLVWTAKDAVPFLLYSSGGTIPDRGYFALKDQRTGTPLGSLDEEFVWERSLGDRFALGAQVWKIMGIDDQSVQVEPVDAPPHIIPFWKAEDQDRSWFLAEKIGLFLEEADRALVGDPVPWMNNLVAQDGFSTEAADRLLSTLQRERAILGLLPHRWRMVVEQVESTQPGASPDTAQYVIHTFWGARINRPWAFALAQAWEDVHGYALETYPGDDQVLILVPPEISIEEVFVLVTPVNLEDLIRRRLEATGYFGARFREGAGRALLLPKPGFDKRMPLWQTRLRSKRLFEAVTAFSDFPILWEAWRQCLSDEFDLPMLKTLLAERGSGQISTHFCRTSEPSPFTEGLLWRQINDKMYADDTPTTRRPSTLDTSLWDQLVATDRPRLPRSLIEDWESRWGRTAPGYAPETPADLADHLEVRVALSLEEWDRLIQACARDSGQTAEEWFLRVPSVVEDGRVGVAALVPLWQEPQTLWIRWLEGRGPVSLDALSQFWGCSPEVTEAWVDTASAMGAVVTGLLSDDAQGPEVCLNRTWDQLVRRLRLDRRSAIPVRPAPGLALHLARWQGLVTPRSEPKTQTLEPEILQRRVGQLLGLPVAADLWEAAILPARVQPYRPADFDQLFIEGGLRWFGVGPAKIVLGFPEDRSTFLPAMPTDADDQLRPIFGDQGIEASFVELAQRSGLATGPLAQALWALAWQGLASATTFGPLRQGLRAAFQYQGRGDSPRASAGGFQRWSSARGSAGTWHRWDTSSTKASGALDQLEDTKRRARLVLDRYGLVFRSLLAHEGTSFQWRALFPALRLMELSGEIVGGMFWSGIPELQFATPEALRFLDAGQQPETFWVQHAQDPSSLCGLSLESFSHLPRRAVGTWLWWKGAALVAILSAGGKKLEQREPLSEADWAPLVARMAGLLLSEGKTHWALETIDKQIARDHPLASILMQTGFRPSGERLYFWKSP